MKMLKILGSTDSRVRNKVDNYTHLSPTPSHMQCYRKHIIYRFKKLLHYTDLKNPFIRFMKRLAYGDFRKRH